jgi:hypothetical protein
MRNLQPPFILGLIIFLTATTGCQESFKNMFPEKSSTAVSAIADVSDTGLIHTTAEEVTAMFPINDNRLYEGYTFRCRYISEAEDRGIMQVNVKPVCWLLSDENYRIAQLKAFRAEVNQAIDQLEQEQVQPRKNSLVLQTISREMTQLASANAQNKSMIIFSDLLQYDENFSFYSPRDFAVAKKNPELAAEQLDQISPLPNVEGLKVYIVYRPQNYEQQKRFDVASRVFTLLLIKHGATVYVTPNIVTNG